MKSIKSISQDTGISKVSLYKLIRKPELIDHVKKDGNITLIDDIGEQIIIEYYSRQRLATLNDILDENTDEPCKLEENEGVSHVSKPRLQSVNEVYNVDFIMILENQLNAKDEQLKEKDTQIKTKDEQIKQKDNQLNALLILLNKEKDIKLIGDSTMGRPNIHSAEPPKEGFFKRLFKKK